ncbi:hypothetical protein FRC12_012302 [Ceratobasidium sp. 428]|nr:hypothetical protein FRC12_012302 [Ceratobasidium sp. 428]
MTHYFARLKREIFPGLHKAIVQMQPSSSRRPPGPLALPRLESGGWITPAALSRATSPWESGQPSAFADLGQTYPAPPTLRPLRLSLLQHRADSSASTAVNPPNSPQPLSPSSPDAASGYSPGLATRPKVLQTEIGITRGPLFI